MILKPTKTFILTRVIWSWTPAVVVANAICLLANMSLHERGFQAISD